MRDIKFRCWDKNQEKMLSVIEPKEQGKREYYPFEILVGFSYWDKTDFELLLFTGLYDKHNNPIYEGHIVSYNYIIGVIVFKDGAFGIEVKSDFYTKNNTSDIEIIGNKFENPELLKQ